MLGSDDHRNLVRVRPVLRLVGNDDEPGMVRRIVIDIGCQDLQSVQLGCLPGSHRAFGQITALAYHLGAAGRIEKGYQFDPGMLFEKLPALFQSLGMGIDLPQSFNGSAGKGQQVLIHFDDLFPYDVTVIFPHQVIHFRDASGRGILYGQHTVFDFMFLDGNHHIFKMHKIHFHFGDAVKVIFQRLVAEGAPDPLIAHPDGFGRLLFLLYVVCQDIDLQIAAGLHYFFHNAPHVGPVGGIFQLPDYFGNDLFLPLPVQHLHMALIFVGCHLLHYIHPLFQRVCQNRIQPVDFLTEFR